MPLVVDWSVKDVLNHVAAWQEAALRVIGDLRAGRWGRLGPSVERFNLRQYAADRDRSLDETLQRLQSARAALLLLLAQVDETTLPAADPMEDERAMKIHRDVSLPEPLHDMLDRLSRHDRVLGALLLGSLAAGALTPASDYDLVVVVDVGEPVWYVGVTEIGGRFADIVVVAGHALAQIQALDAPVGHDHALAPVLRWISDGVIVLDRGGLRAAQEHARTHDLLTPPDTASAYSAWFGLNYNLAVVRRLLRSDDPRYLAVADIRMAIYGHADLWFGYFAIRGQPWSGDKAALRALEAQDPTYLALFRQCIAESRRTEKARLYAEVSALAAAPFGGLWPPGWTGENLAHPPLRIAALLGKP